MYHDLLPDNAVPLKGYYGGKPTKRSFRAHLIALRKRFRIISVEEAVTEIKNTGKLATPSACITFDDGCRTVYDLAFPVLREFGITATVFLPTGWINRTMVPWWIVLRNIIAGWNPDETGFNELISELMHESDFKSSEPKNSVDNKRDLLAGLDDFLRDKTEPEIVVFLEFLKKAAKTKLPEKLEGDDPMSWEQIEEMAGAGIRFGAHTVTHINLKYADKITAEKEIVESRNEIEKHLPGKVKGFAYPYGMDIQSYRKLTGFLQKQGFDYACTAVYGNNPDKADPFMLKRITLPVTESQALLGRTLILDYYQE